MSEPFEAGTIGPMELKNRFVHSATCENMATSEGEVTDRLVERYRRPARTACSSTPPTDTSLTSSSPPT